MFTSSLSGIIALPLDDTYVTNKRELTLMCESIYYELKPYNIALKELLSRGSMTKFRMEPYILNEYAESYKYQPKYLLGGEERFIVPEECAHVSFEAGTNYKDEIYYSGEHIAKKLLDIYYSMSIEKFKEYFYNLLQNKN